MLILRAMPVVLLMLTGAARAADAPSSPASVAPVTPVKPLVVTATKDIKAPWNGEKIVCTRVAPVGSLIAVRHCTTKSVDDDNRRQAADVLTRATARMDSNDPDPNGKFVPF